MMTTKWGLSTVTVFTLVLVMSGCYTYRAVDSATIGSSVRVRLPIEGPVAARGVPDFVNLEGVLVELGDSISLAVQTRREYGAYREVVQNDTLVLAVDRLSAFEIKEFSRNRSVALGVTIGGAIAYGAWLGLGLGGGGAGDPGGGIPLPDASLVATPVTGPGMKLDFNPMSLIKRLLGG